MRVIEPAPLTAPPGFSVAIEARGAAGAHNLRFDTDGTLLADSTDPTLLYEIHPAREAEPAAVMSVAPALRASGRHYRATTARNPLQLRWDVQAAQITFAAPANDVSPEFAPTPRSVRVARLLNGQRDLSAVAMPDGTVFAVDARAGLVYRFAPQPTPP